LKNIGSVITYNILKNKFEYYIIMDDIEYNDIKYIVDIFKKYYKTIQSYDNDIEYNDTKFCIDKLEKYFGTIQSVVYEKTNTLRLTQEFNEKFFRYTRKSIDISNLSIMKDDIKNYRPLTDIQLKQIEDLTEAEKIEIIKTYNIMFASIKNLII